MAVLIAVFAVLEPERSEPWVKELSQPPPDATPENGWAHVVDVPTRKLTLRAQFDERRLPIRPLHYEARPRFLLRPLAPPEPLELEAGNVVAYSWSNPDEGTACVLRWEWPEQLKTVALTP